MASPTSTSMPTNRGRTAVWAGVRNALEPTLPSPPCLDRRDGWRMGSVRAPVTLFARRRHLRRLVLKNSVRHNEIAEIDLSLDARGNTNEHDNRRTEQLDAPVGGNRRWDRSRAVSHKRRHATNAPLSVDLAELVLESFAGWWLFDD